MSRNPATGKTEHKRVVRTMVHRTSTVLTVHLADGKTGREVEAITATGNHPFYVAGAGFVEAERLGIGCQIVTRAGPDLVVKSIDRQRRRQGYLVYNFEVQDDHTYFVGKADGGAWVHNPNIECTTIARGMQRRLAGQGEIIRVEPIIGRERGVLTPNKPYEHFSGRWGHHDVLVHEGRVYDPIMEETTGRNAWVDYEKWMERWDMEFHVIRPWTKGMLPYGK